jgi:hypothetical protein
VSSHALLSSCNKFNRFISAEQRQCVAFKPPPRLCTLPRVGGLRRGVNAVDDDLLAAAQNFNFVRMTVRRNKNRRGELVEWDVGSIQHCALRRLSDTNPVCPKHTFSNLLQFVSDIGIHDVDVDGRSRAGQNSCIRRIGILIFPTVMSSFVAWMSCHPMIGGALPLIGSGE